MTSETILYIVGCELVPPEDRNRLRKLTDTTISSTGKDAAVIESFPSGGFNVTWWHVPEYNENTIQWMRDSNCRQLNTITARRWLSDQENANGE